MNKPSNPEFKATYFREYGIHSVPNGSSEDHLVSFPTWDETADALKNNLPSSGRIITPEYITAPSDIKDIEESTALIQDRIDFAKDLSRQTDAELYLGTPYKTRTPGSNTEASRDIWHNSVLTLKNGEIIDTTNKEKLLFVEREAGIELPIDRNRTIRNGRAVLICAELYYYPRRASELFKQMTTEIIAPTMWATPVGRSDGKANELNVHAIEHAGSADNYYRQKLEQVIGSFTMAILPNVDRVTTVDRGRPDIPPYNAVFERIKR